MQGLRSVHIIGVCGTLMGAFAAFLKRSGIGYLSEEGYKRLQGITTTLADYEDFPAHAMAIRKRNQILGI